MSLIKTKVSYTRLMEEEPSTSTRLLEDFQAASTNLDKTNWESVELRSRGRTIERNTRNDKSEFWISNNTEFIEREVHSGDTLQKIALQYSVQISELKRINCLMNDQDLFARKMLKIPLSRLSSAADLKVLDENPLPSTSEVNEGKLIHIDGSEANSGDSFLPLSDHEDFNTEPPPTTLRVRTSSSSFESTSPNSSSQKKQLKSMLKEVDKKLETLKQRQAAREELFNAENGITTHFIAATEPNGLFSNNFTLPQIVGVLLCLIFVFVIIPVGYAIYGTIYPVHNDPGASSTIQPS